MKKIKRHLPLVIVGGIALYFVLHSGTVAAYRDLCAKNPTAFLYVGEEDVCATVGMGARR